MVFAGVPPTGFYLTLTCDAPDSNYTCTFGSQELRLFGARVPIVTLVDGHPHTLAFLAGAAGAPISCLGVQNFGQSGDISELYEHHQIDAESVVGAALDLLDS